MRSGLGDADQVGVGLGQTVENELMQAGTASDWVNGTQQYFLWYELFPAEAGTPLESVSPGDLVGVHVAYNQVGPQFHVWDTTKSYSNTFLVSFQGGDDGHAEWIYERPIINNSLPYLAEAPATFIGAQASTGSGWTTLSAASDVAVDMYNCSNTIELASPEGIQGSGTFTERWDNAGEIEACVQ